MKPFLLLPVGIICILFACARPGVPTGGVKDTTPPGIDSSESTPNLQTNFTQRTFKLTFDEWVVLKETSSQVVTSPPLDKRPEITLKGKTVTVTFAEEEAFRPNTTYTVNFGTAVRDLHEDNPAEDLRFVFSTGDQIDSLKVEGQIVDALAGSPVENVAVMLYDITEDSVVAQERPYYFARTNKSGQFSIGNVRSGTFKCAAVEDANLNLKWDEGDERIAFSDTLIQVSDSLKGRVVMRLFSNQSEARLKEKLLREYGIIQLVYSAPPDSITLRALEKDKALQVYTSGDTLTAWYTFQADSSWQALAGQDTLNIKALSRENFQEKHRFSWITSKATASASSKRKRQTNDEKPEIGRPPNRVVSLRPGNGITLDFSAPISAFDSSLVVWKNDSVSVAGLTLLQDSMVPFRMVSTGKFEAGTSYELLLLPGALTDIYGAATTDTLGYTINVPALKQLSTLNLTVENLKPSTSYVLQVKNNDKLIEERIFLSEAATQRFVFPALTPISYQLQLIEDINANGRWDSGSYYDKKQPERIFSQKTEALKANWEVEVTMDVGDRKKKF